MRKLLVPAAVAALLATSALSFAAATQHASGTVKEFDSKAMTLTLADGDTYVLPKAFKNPGLKAGEHVSIKWQMSGDKRDAESVTLMK